MLFSIQHKCNLKAGTSAVQPGTYILHRGVGQASTHADDTAGQHTTQAVCGEAGAEHGLNLVLQDHAGLITAQVGHGCRGRSGRGGVRPSAKPGQDCITGQGWAGL